MSLNFDHEKLKAYQEAVRFVSLTSVILEDIPKRLPVCDQLDRASTSIPLNIAEGNGKFTPRDKCRFLDIARGSALECAACVDVLLVRNQISQSLAAEAKGLLMAIVRMLVGLIKSISEDRLHEDPAPYTS